MKHIKIFAIGFVIMSIIAGIVITQNDPVELAKTERDEKLQASAAEFSQATVLYYSVHSALPWFSEEERGVNCFENSSQLVTVPMNAIEDCVTILIEDNALRKDYLTSTPLKSLVVSNPNPQTGEKLDTIVCFQPQSNVWQKDANTRYNIDGTNAPADRCYSQGGSEFCYWCTQ